MKVLILTNIPSPYRVDFFNELGKLCELTVVFERGHSSERDESWKNFRTEHFAPVFLKGIKRGVANAVCPGVVRHLKKGRYDHIIVTNFTSATGMLAISWMRMRGIPYWLESDGGFAKNGSGMKEKVKRHFIKGAAGYFSTAEEHDRYYLQYGAKKARLHRYPFTSLYRRDVLDAPVSREQKQALRQKLGMTEENILLAVGRFVPGKGYDCLIDAMTMLSGEIGCYIVGGVPGQAYLEQVAKHGLQNVHFVDFKKKADLAEYYMAADVFVHPTKKDVWGLVINEAMAKGLPIITTDQCIAGLELVREPGDGAIIPVGDAAHLAQAISDVLGAANADNSARILEKIKRYSFEEMARRHIEILTEY